MDKGMKELGAYTYEWNGKKNLVQLVEMENADGWQVHKYRILINGKLAVWSLQRIDNGCVTNDCDDLDKMTELFGRMTKVWEMTEKSPAPEWMEGQQKYVFATEQNARQLVDYKRMESKKRKNYYNNYTWEIKPMIMPYVIANRHYGVYAD